MPRRQEAHHSIAMITTVTLNPMVDKTVTVDALRPGVIRASRMELAVGGKGVNVARQLSRLGVAVTATGLWGGETGTLLERLMSEEGIRHEFFPIAALTREGVTYRTADGGTTAVFEPPHRVTSSEAAAFLAWIIPRLGSMEWLVCSGSSPSAECDGIYRELISAAARAGVRTVLDSYGIAFRNGLLSRPTLLKPNRQEYEETFGTALRAEADFHDAIRSLLRTASMVVMTDGASPCYAGSAAGVWKYTPPHPPSINPTGSGDSMVAGILYGLTQAWPFEESVRFGVAAGSANAGTWEVAACSLEEIRRHLAHVGMHRLE